ncbi:tRNA pseudouridine38-40 synthase [Acetitomaculum ruminis DSM 5522]|uniref:tRNA pseudouridine synthase A n=1 Tax=Acetitomaculum ruminis DSM 5522 TaxID=1120918 RepID=A0A1I0YQR1_9FIRM|nr:tRNA pseudouridine(38-40) synthase TruA [Acetitomaculum ruminis]SFB15715.1 tRNA pseudouridine38-40 synthase [Acetitomaculum ruminis DSM 5522]
MKENIKMTISYDGSAYYGWQHQNSTDKTIQGRLEVLLSVMTGILPVEAVEKDKNFDLKKYVRRAQAGMEKPLVEVIGAGRTDAGVHARAMTANAIIDTDMSEKEIKDYLNRYLPEDISVNEVKVAAMKFHSRYNALGKTYRYTFWYGDKKPVFERKYVTVLDEMPDIEEMKKAAALLVGSHDFKSFCGNSKMKKSTVRNVDNIDIQRNGSYIRIYVHGDGFLQNMVRIIAGTLIEVGMGKLKAKDMTDILEAKDRKAAGYTAPAKGLCLMKVDY